MMPRGLKRKAQVPDLVYRFGCGVSKADLLEAAYDMAGLLTPECDNEKLATEKLREHLNRVLESHGRKPIVYN